MDPISEWLAGFTRDTTNSPDSAKGSCLFILYCPLLQSTEQIQDLFWLQWWGRHQHDQDQHRGAVHGVAFFDLPSRLDCVTTPSSSLSLTVPKYLQISSSTARKKTGVHLLPAWVVATKKQINKDAQLRVGRCKLKEEEEWLSLSEWSLFFIRN